MKRVRKRARDLFTKLNEAKHGIYSTYINEVGFRKIVKFSIIASFVVIFLPIDVAKKVILISSLLIPMSAELINSAIERAVDVATERFHERAREAKDISSSVVYISVVFTASIWIITLLLV